MKFNTITKIKHIIKCDDEDVCFPPITICTDRDELNCVEVVSESGDSLLMMTPEQAILVADAIRSIAQQLVK